MSEPTLADLFAEARTLLEDKTAPCPYHPVLEDDSDPTRRICACRGSSRRPDPAYDALRALFRARLARFNEYPDGDIAKSPTTITMAEEAEDYWEQAPDGALEGALIKPLLSLGTVAHMAVDGLLDDIGTLLETEGDTRIPAMQALVEWLKGEA